MDIFAPGSEVQVNGHRSKIIAVHIYAKQCVRYTVAWWKDGARVESLVEAFEVTETANTFTKTIGFKS